MGVALAWVIIYPVVLIVLAREAFRVVHVSRWVIWEQLWPPMAASGVMTASVLVVRWAISSWRNDPSLVRLVLMVSAGAITYGATLMAYGGPVRSEIQEATGWLFRRAQVTTAVK